MATSYKVLGQSTPTANTATTLYTVPASTEAVISTINICNAGTAPSIFRIAIRPNGENLATKHYLIYDNTIVPQETITLTLGVTMDATDIFEIYSSRNNVAFNLFGSEIS
jgi:hypothetical protein